MQAGTCLRNNVNFSGPRKCFFRGKTDDQDWRATARRLMKDGIVCCNFPTNREHQNWEITVTEYNRYMTVNLFYIFTNRKRIIMKTTSNSACWLFHWFLWKFAYRKKYRKFDVVPYSFILQQVFCVLILVALLFKTGESTCEERRNSQRYVESFNRCVGLLINCFECC